MYSLDAKGARKGTKNLAILYVGVPICDKIGRKGGTRSLVGLCVFLKFKLANRQLLTSNAYNICQKKLLYQEVAFPINL